MGIQKKTGELKKLYDKVLAFHLSLPPNRESLRDFKQGMA